MIDLYQLDRACDSRDFPLSELAYALDMKQSQLRKKLKHSKVTIGEVVKISEILNLSHREVERIFYPDYAARQIAYQERQHA